MAPRVAVVTGTSTGIGFHLALQLAAKEYTVVATARDVSSAPESLTSTCDVQSLDVTDESSAAKFAEYVSRTYARCDVLINNAGFGISGNVEAMSIDDAKRIFDVNVWGVARMCQLLVPLMRRKRAGLVITVSSTSGLRGLPCADAYTASKMAIQGMMESYRYSVEQDNIKIAMVNPGPTTSAFAERMKTELSELEKASTENDPCPALTKHYCAMVNTRNSVGQSSEDCARNIVHVVEREIGKDLRKGDTVFFMNGTSDYARKVISDVLRHPDGYSGQQAEIYKDVRAVIAQLKE